MYIVIYMYIYHHLLQSFSVIYETHEKNHLLHSWLQSPILLPFLPFCHPKPYYLIVFLTRQFALATL